MKQIARILTAIVSKGIAHQASKKVKERKRMLFCYLRLFFCWKT